MHLGDSETGRCEIVAFCSKCTEGFLRGKMFLMTLPSRMLFWKVKKDKKKEKTFMIGYLTKKAWKWRDVNSPNYGGAEIVKLKPKPYIFRWESTTTSGEGK